MRPLRRPLKNASRSKAVLTLPLEKKKEEKIEENSKLKSYKK